MMSSLTKPSTSPRKSPISAQHPSYNYRPGPNKAKSAGVPVYNFDSTPSSATTAQKQTKNSEPNQSNNLLKEDQRQELLVMTIDLGDGSKDLLRVHEGEDPFELAVNFCEKHGLSTQLVEPLAQNIYVNMEHVLEESVQTLDIRNSGNDATEATDVRHSSEVVQETGKFKNLGELAQEARGNLSANRSDNGGTAYQDPENEEYQEGEGAPQDRDEHEIIEEEYSLDKFQDGERSAQKSGTLQRYPEDQEGYEMADHEENPEEKPGMMRPNHSSGSLVEHRVSEKAQQFPNKSAEVQRYPLRQDDRRFESALPYNGNEGKGQNAEQLNVRPVIKSLAPGHDFQSEEEYLEHIINNQYGDGKDQQQGKQFVNKQQDEKASVYERLHNQAMMRKQKAAAQTAQAQAQASSQASKKANSSVSQSIASQSQMQDINYGTLLYHRGIKKTEETQKNLVEKRKGKIDEMTKECTFKPDLSRISQQIMSTKARSGDVSDKLIKAGKTTQEKLERARSSKVNQELDECTFQPEINVISQRIDEEKSQMTVNSPQNRCFKLYNESIMRQRQQEINTQSLPSDYTFKPAINNYNSPTSETFEQREQKFRDRMERINHMRLIKEESEVRDLETGQALFKPKTGRAPKDGRNNGAVPIGDRLFNQQHKIADAKKKLLQEKERTIEANRAKSNEKSQAIVENLLIRRLEEVFTKFDSDGDGLISSAKIDITLVPTEILETLAPLLCEMEEHNQVLDFPSFVAEADRLLKTLTVTERNSLLFGRRGNTNEPQFTFKPEIDKKSEKLAQKKHPYGDFNSLYGSYLEERKKIDAKIKEKQELKSQEELKGCSFKPLIMTQPKSTTSAASNSKIYFENDFIL